MLEWNDARGTMTLNGVTLGHGYSGLGGDKNNPGAVTHTGTGPIPPGTWHLQGVEDSPNTGPFTIVLEPGEGTDTHGRSAFRIHGDSVSHPGEASHGCIILPRDVREAVWASGERTLTVV